MKKLIVMAAVVCAAVAAQAARITWSASNVKTENDVLVGSGTVKIYYKLESAKEWTSRSSTSSMSNGAFSWQSMITLTNGSKYEAYYTIDEDSATYFKSATTQFTPSGASSTSRFTVDLGNSGTWGSPEPTPEPTSGLLMLIGMGALALKRRRV